MSVASQEPRELPSLWRPIRVPTFRNLLVADVASDVGTFMQERRRGLDDGVRPNPLHYQCTQYGAETEAPPSA